MTLTLPFPGTLALALATFLGGWLTLKAAAPAPTPADAANDPEPDAEAVAQADEEPADTDTGQPLAPTAPKTPNPYQAIVDRNAFGLRPQPPPPPPPEPPAPAANASALKLSGITTLLSGKRAMFVLQEAGKQQLYSDLLREGEKDNVITNLEVLQIDEKAGAVRVVFGGKELALNFTEHGLKPPTAAAPPTPGQPGMPGQPGTTPRPGAPTPVPGRAVTPGATPIPTALSPGGETMSGGLRSIPPRPSRLQFNRTTGGLSAGIGNPGQLPATEAAGFNPAPEVPAPSLPQQVEVMRAQENTARQVGLPFPPLPPIPGLVNPQAPDSPQ